MKVQNEWNRQKLLHEMSQEVEEMERKPICFEKIIRLESN